MWRVGEPGELVLPPLFFLDCPSSSFAEQNVDFSRIVVEERLVRYDPVMGRLQCC